MSIKLGIYDFFSYLIPGGIVTAALVFLLNRHVRVGIDFSNLSIVFLLLFATLAYLVGFATDFVVRNSWYRLFRRKDLFEVTMANFNKRHTTLQVMFQEMDWYIPFSYIKSHNMEMAQDIEKFGVINLMLRNSSFGFLLFAAACAVEYFLNGHAVIDGITAVGCVALSIILAFQSVKFLTRFYQTIFQSLVALVATPEQMPVKFVSKTKRSRQARG